MKSKKGGRREQSRINKWIVECFVCIDKCIKEIVYETFTSWYYFSKYNWIKRKITNGLGIENGIENGIGNGNGNGNGKLERWKDGRINLVRRKRKEKLL